MPPKRGFPIAFTPAQLAMYDEFYLDGLRAPHNRTCRMAQVNDEFVRVAQRLAADHPEHQRASGAQASSG